MSTFKYNKLQEELLNDFIERGGRMTRSQPFNVRGAGYSTFVAVQCLQQALTTDREIAYVYDGRHDIVPDDMCRLAVNVFGVTPAWDRRRGMIYLGHKTIRLFKPTRYGDYLRGRHFDDVFVDVAGETIRDNYEFFENLRMVQERSSLRSDGTGLHLVIIR